MLYIKRKQDINFSSKELLFLNNFSSIEDAVRYLDSEIYSFSNLKDRLINQNFASVKIKSSKLRGNKTLPDLLLAESIATKNPAELTKMVQRMQDLSDAANYRTHESRHGDSWLLEDRKKQFWREAQEQLGKQLMTLRDMPTSKGKGIFPGLNRLDINWAESAPSGRIGVIDGLLENNARRSAGTFGKHRKQNQNINSTTRATQPTEKASIGSLLLDPSKREAAPHVGVNISNTVDLSTPSRFKDMATGAGFGAISAGAGAAAYNAISDKSGDNSQPSEKTPTQGVEVADEE